MTLLLIYEAEAAGKFAWEDAVTVSEHAASMGGSQLWLEPGETLTAAEMTKCIVIASANDAAVAMAELIGGSEQGFVELMNQRAQELGMTGSHFVNACGLDDEGHVMSARDIAIASRELLLHFPEISEYATTWMDSITHKTSRGESEFGLTNTNKLIRQYEGITGLKTGSTDEALYCLSASAKRGGLHLVAVVMAAPNPTTRFQEAKQLLDYGFANYDAWQGEIAGAEQGVLPVEKGEADQVTAVAAETVSVLMPKTGSSQVETRVELEPGVMAPISAGTVVGRLSYWLDGEEVGSTDLIAAETVEKAGWTTMAKRLLEAWW